MRENGREVKKSGIGLKKVVGVKIFEKCGRWGENFFPLHVFK